MWSADRPARRRSIRSRQSSPNRGCPGTPPSTSHRRRPRRPARPSRAAAAATAEVAAAAAAAAAAVGGVEATAGPAVAEAHAAGAGVIDIGGGSTECILGERFEPLLVDSLRWVRRLLARYFPGGAIRRGATRRRCSPRGSRCAARRRASGSWAGRARSARRARSAPSSRCCEAAAGARAASRARPAQLADALVDAGHADQLELRASRRSAAPCSPAASRSSGALRGARDRRASRRRTARCGKACSTTCSAASATRTCATARSARSWSATTSTGAGGARRAHGARPPRQVAAGLGARPRGGRALPVLGGAAPRDRPRPFFEGTTVTAPTSSGTPTCPASARTSSPSRP